MGDFSLDPVACLPDAGRPSTPRRVAHRRTYIPNPLRQDSS